MNCNDAGHSFLRIQLQTRTKGHTATGAVCYRMGLSGTSTFDGPSGEKRTFDYSRRTDIIATGYAAPPGTDQSWRDPLTWAHRIEAVDKRKNSRQCRDDIVAIPVALVEAGLAEEAIQTYADRLAQLHDTPVQWAFHKPDRGGKNYHCHFLYAGRRLNGLGFAKHRDREQDNPKDKDAPDLAAVHKGVWSEVCGPHGIELTWSSETPGHHLGPQVCATKRRRLVAETRDAIAKTIAASQTGEAAPDERTLDEVAVIASGVNDGLTVEPDADDRVAPRTARPAGAAGGDGAGAAAAGGTAAERVRAGDPAADGDCTEGLPPVEKTPQVLPPVRRRPRCCRRCMRCPRCCRRRPSRPRCCRRSVWHPGCCRPRDARRCCRRPGPLQRSCRRCGRRPRSRSRMREPARELDQCVVTIVLGTQREVSLTSRHRRGRPCASNSATGARHRAASLPQEQPRTLPRAPAAVRSPKECRRHPQPNPTGSGCWSSGSWSLARRVLEQLHLKKKRRVKSAPGAAGAVVPSRRRSRGSEAISAPRAERPWQEKKHGHRHNTERRRPEWQVVSDAPGQPAADLADARHLRPTRPR